MGIIERAKGNPHRIAIVSEGVKYSYDQLVNDSQRLASVFLKDQKDLNEAPVAFMIGRAYQYPVCQWAIWQAGGIAVPLHSSHPLSSIKYILEDTGSQILVTNDTHVQKLTPLAKELDIELINIDQENMISHIDLPQITNERKAMILYTSGTTSKPKGVVTSHLNIETQIKSLVNAWAWKEDDHILNILPLHHVHGIINVMSCALWTGACCEFLEKWNAEKVWQKLFSGEVNVFMAVPTIYYKLIKFWKENLNQKTLVEELTHLRLMVSGSAALPVPVFTKWQEITGHTLLERYGMTEIGMALSNPYSGERRAGHVGHALPGVEIRLMDKKEVITEEESPGEIQVKGDNVFQSYWGKPQATKESFDNGWFKTGDIAQIEGGYYKILGRDSVDIIKSGGYKISALEIENIVLEDPSILECAVIGIEDLEWGEIVGCCIVSDLENINTNELKTRLLKKLPRYKIPRKYIFKDALPKNAMGKVSKKEVKKMF